MRYSFTAAAALTFAAELTFFALPAAAEPQRYELDPSHTTVSFMIGHIGFADVLGIFGAVEGGFTYDMETQALSDLEVRVQTESVNTFDDARDGHVRDPDFLNVSEFPTMVFTADGGTAEGDTSGTVTGDLSLLGQTKPLTLDVTLNKAAEYPFGHKKFVLGISARGSVMRSDYGMMYGVQGDIVGDRVDIIIETEALRME